MLDLSFKLTNLGKSKITSGDAFKVIVINNRNKKGLTFIFNDDCLDGSDEMEMLLSRFRDAAFYENCKNYKGYTEFDGEKDHKLMNTCKKAFKDIKRVFNEEERKELKKLWFEY